MTALRVRATREKQRGRNNDIAWLETDAIAGVSSARLTWPCDFNDVAPLEAVITRHRVGQLDARKLRLLQPASR